jgi:5'-3' exonuclease
MKFDLERIIDDFIFFCFFIGNDFLPSISALDIAEGSLDCLIDFYKLTLPTLDDYITKEGVINWERAEKLIWILGDHEDEVFKERLDSRGANKEKFRTVSVTQDINPLMTDSNDRGNRSIQTFNLFKEKIFQKKVQKVAKLKARGDGKKYKKFLISKMFKEDADNKVRIPAEAREGLVAKF